MPRERNALQQEAVFYGLADFIAYIQTAVYLTILKRASCSYTHTYELLSAQGPTLGFCFDVCSGCGGGPPPPHTPVPPFWRGCCRWSEGTSHTWFLNSVEPTTPAKGSGGQCCPCSTLGDFRRWLWWTRTSFLWVAIRLHAIRCPHELCAFRCLGPLCTADDLDGATTNAQAARSPPTPPW